MGKLRKSLFLLYNFNVVLILLFTSENSLSQTSWTKIEYYYNVGSLPPPYQYNYTITITNEGNAELVYISGYAKPDKNTYKYEVEIDDYKLRNLKAEITQSNIMNLKIGQMPNEEIPDGGHSDYLLIFNNDELIAAAPYYPESKYEELLNQLYKVIVKCIPDRIWNEIESQKADNIQD